MAQLTKDRDAYIRAKKEIKIKTDAVDVHLAGFARVRCFFTPPLECLHFSPTSCYFSNN